MFIMASIVQSIALIAAGALIAGLLCWSAAAVADRLHHPRWSAILVLMVLLILLLTGLARSEFVRLGGVCAFLGAIFLWISSGNPIRPTKTVERSDG